MRRPERLARSLIIRQISLWASEEQQVTKREKKKQHIWEKKQQQSMLIQAVSKTIVLH